MYLLNFGGNTCLFWTMSKWISLLLQMLSLVFVWRHLTCNMSCLRPPLARQWAVCAVECGGEGESPLSASCCGPLGGWRKHFLLYLPLSLARKHQLAKTWQNPSPAPPTTTHSFDTKITLAGTRNSHISGFFASVIFIMVYFFNFIFVSLCVHAVVKKYLLLN